MVETSGFKSLGAIVYDRTLNEIVWSYDFAEHGIGRPDHVSMSPHGNYLVASWYYPQSCDNREATYNNPCGLMAFNWRAETATHLSYQGEHSDICIADGFEVIVNSNYKSGFVEMVRLADGKVTNLFPLYINGSSTAFHFCGKAFDKPGWVLVSTYGTTQQDEWWSDKIFACELKENPRIVMISDTFTAVDPTGTGIYAPYFAEPHASVNRDFTKVVWNTSNGVADNDEIDVHMAKLPADLLE
jgi:hypothetical protein